MARSGKGEGDVGQGSPAPPARGRRNNSGDAGEPKGRGTAVSNLDTGQRDQLAAIQARLSGVLADPETPARDLASVARELRQTAAALAALAPPSAGSALDEIAARRRSRGAS